jgi:hypothetical protein
MSANDCGIYALYFPDGSTYVGASKSMRTRIQTQQSWLRKGNGQTKPLQDKFNEYGPPLSKTVLRCAPENLRMYEMLVFNTLDKPLCKPHPGGIAGKTLSEETKKKMSESAKKKDNSCQSLRQLESWKDEKIKARRLEGMRSYWERVKNAKQS